MVYTPQIIENYRRKSGEGLSVTFVVIWLIGDLFNLFGAILAGLLPTVIILAVYVSNPKCGRAQDLKDRPVLPLRHVFVVPDILLSMD